MIVLYRFRGGRGERLELESKGHLVTWRVVPLGVHEPRIFGRTELAPDLEHVDDVVARVEREHRDEGFVELDASALAQATASIEPFASWRRLTADTFATQFAYLGAGVVALAARIRAIQPNWRVELDSGTTLTFALPIAYEPELSPADRDVARSLQGDPEVYADWLEQRGRLARAEWVRRARPGADDVERDPDVLRAYWSRHAAIRAQTHDGFDIVLARDASPPEPPELDVAVVQWVMSRGYEQYWFLAGDGTLRLYDLDGGMGEPIATTLGELWLAQVHRLA